MGFKDPSFLLFFFFILVGFASSSSYVSCNYSYTFLSFFFHILIYFFVIFLLLRTKNFISFSDNFGWADESLGDNGTTGRSLLQAKQGEVVISFMFNNNFSHDSLLFLSWIIRIKLLILVFQNLYKEKI